MRNKVMISIVDLKLNTVESKKLLKLIRGIEGLDGSELKTGLEYDSFIEDGGEDSEMVFSEISFYVDGDAEIATIIASKAVSLIRTEHETLTNKFVVTMIEVDDIIVLFDFAN
jgi:hypothetical protein